MANAPRLKGEATYEDVENAPEGMVAEIIDGELSLQPRPRLIHQVACNRLWGQLDAKFGGGGDGPGGWFFVEEVELHLFGKKEPMVPDIVGWRRERMPLDDDAPWITLRPDWVCELRSPSTAKWDRMKKLPAYARAGIPHAWLVDVAERFIEIYRLDGESYRFIGGVEGEGKVRAEPFDAADLDLTRLWTR